MVGQRCTCMGCGALVYGDVGGGCLYCGDGVLRAGYFRSVPESPAMVDIRSTCRLCGALVHELVGLRCQDCVSGVSPAGKTVVLTETMLHDAATKLGVGWTRIQLAALDVPWPPPHRWLKGLVGKRVLLTAWERFVAIGLERREKLESRNKAKA